MLQIKIEGTSTGTISLNAGKMYILKPLTSYTISVDNRFSDSLTDPSNGCFFVEQHSQNDSAISGGTRYVGYGNALSVTFTTHGELSYTYMGVFAASGKTFSGTYRVMLREATEDEIAAAQLSPGTLQEGGTADIPQDHPVTLPAYPEEIAETTLFEWCKPGINGVEPTELVTAGKNLAKTVADSGSTNGIEYQITDENEFTITGTATSELSVILLNRNKSITRVPSEVDICVSLATACTFEVWQYFSDGTAKGKRFTGKASATLKTGKRVINIGVFVICKANVPQNLNGRLQIELGTDATSYEPYASSSTPLDLKGHQLHMLPDGTRDELRIDDTGSMEVAKMTKIYELDGSEDWFLHANGKFYVQLETEPILNSELIENAYFSFASTGLNNAYNGSQGIYVTPLFSGQTVDEFKSYLSLIHAVAVVPLKLSQTVQLGSITMPALPADYAYAWAASDIPAYMDVTYWTVAGKDVSDKINDAQNSANDANNKIDEQLPNIEYARSQIEILNKSIATLVVDENGGSLMTQTSDGWKFNIGGIQSTLDDAVHGIQDVKGDMAGIEELANKTNDLANDVAKKTAYINMTQDESGAPVMELGQQDGEFKLRITNTSMDFMQGSQRIAYLSNRQLYIQSSVVTDEMKIGATSGYIWKKRANGNMGLRYVTE